jgi:hypothetical protein
MRLKEKSTAENRIVGQLSTVLITSVAEPHHGCCDPVGVKICMRFRRRPYCVHKLQLPVQQFKKKFK